MQQSKCVYVAYIRATQSKIWDALTKPALQTQYWFGLHQDCDWEPGSSWVMKHPDGRVANAGEILEVDPPRRAVISWRHESRPELAAEGFSRCTYEITADGEMCRLSITHEIDLPDSKLIALISSSWPKAISSLKSFLETGAGLPRPADLPVGAKA